MTPAQKSFERKAAKATARTAVRESRPNDNATSGHREGDSEAEMMKLRLGVDLRRLHDIQSVERKIEVKHLLLPEYDAWIAGVLDADSGADDRVLTHVMIWKIDVGDFAGALPLADYVLRHHLALPERFKRTAGTLVAEETAEAALKAIGQDEPFDVAVLQAVEALTESEDMPDEVRAKLMKATGILLAEQGEALEANADGAAGAKAATLNDGLAYLRRALALDSNAGVKKRVGQIERAVAKLKNPEES